jgi:hypothetical protein
MLGIRGSGGRGGATGELAELVPDFAVPGAGHIAACAIFGGRPLWTGLQVRTAWSRTVPESP